MNATHFEHLRGAIPPNFAIRTNADLEFDFPYVIFTETNGDKGLNRAARFLWGVKQATVSADLTYEAPPGTSNNYGDSISTYEAPAWANINPNPAAEANEANWQQPQDRVGVQSILPYSSGLGDDFEAQISILRVFWHSDVEVGGRWALQLGAVWGGGGRDARLKNHDSSDTPLGSVTMDADFFDATFLPIIGEASGGAAPDSASIELAFTFWEY